jgi:hypothetical protein
VVSSGQLPSAGGSKLIVLRRRRRIGRFRRRFRWFRRWIGLGGRRQEWLEFVYFWIRIKCGKQERLVVREARRHSHRRWWWRQRMELYTALGEDSYHPRQHPCYHLHRRIDLLCHQGSVFARLNSHNLSLSSVVDLRIQNANARSRATRRVQEESCGTPSRLRPSFSSSPGSSRSARAAGRRVARTPRLRKARLRP